MKTKRQIQSEMEYGDVFTLKEFEKLLDDKLIIPYDGHGYFHDGEKETDVCVWDDGLTWNSVKKYPYVCWYNK